MPAIKKRETTAWIKAVAETYGKKVGEIAYIFCSDEKILEVNRQYLQNDYYTDIITFDYCEGNRIAGDLFISLDTVRTNAEQFGATYETELLEAIQMALHKVVGAYAIAVLDRRHPGQIIAARKSSPLVIGVGTDEFFLASDATPIVEYTDKVVYLQDGEIAILENGKPLKLVNLDNETQPAEISYAVFCLKKRRSGR